MEVVLNESEMGYLFAQNPATAGDGGWQGLMVSLQKKTDRTTGRLELTARDIQRIKTYASYDEGTYETRLQRAFGRTLGPNLDGSPQ